MKIALLQQDICWANTKENQRRSEEAIFATPLCDLYVLPEMWSTGFGNPKNLIQSGFDYNSDDSLEWMKSISKRLNAAIAGSLSVKTEDGTYRNRLYFVTPDTIEFYDKHHLFSYGKEHLCYTAGQEKKIVEWRGVKFLLQVCYDLRFPCFSRNGVTKNEDGSLYDYDCAIYVASWPTPRISVWHTLLQARAIENQCYVIGVNRVGNDPVCSYNGGTRCIDAYGHIIASCQDEKPSVFTVELDLERLTSFRKKFPVLEDI